MFFSIIQEDGVWKTACPAKECNGRLAAQSSGALERKVRKHARESHGQRNVTFSWPRAK